MTRIGEVIHWGAALDGTRGSAVYMENVCVRFEPKDATHNDEAASLAIEYHRQDDRRDALVDRADAERRAALDALVAARAESARLRAQIQPDPPLRFLGPCVARFDPAGKGIWLLSKRDKGWSSSGFLYSSWDEIFRRFDAHVTGHGADEAGEYWILVNREQAKGAKP